MASQQSSFFQRARHAPDRLLERSPWPILAVCCTAMFLDLTNLSAITIALPAIQRSTGIDSSSLQWVLAGYALTFGSFLLLGGRGGDMFGHRRVLIFGSTVFAIFTICCAVAPSFISLVIFRALQGIGAAFTIPSAQAHIAVTFTDPKQKAKALGCWGAAGSVGFVAGLILGGVLTSALNWRWIFYVSFMLSIVVVIAEIFILPHRKPSQAPPQPTKEISLDSQEPPKRSITTKIQAGVARFDVVGILLGVPGLCLLSYGLSSGEDKGWGSTEIVAILLISVFMLILFVMHEGRATSPLLVPKLFKAASFNLTLVLAIFTYAIRQAATYFLTLQLQQYGNSPIHTSVLFIPIGVSATIVGLVAGKLVPLLGAKIMFIVGWALSIPGVVLFIFVTPTSSYWAFTFPGMILYVAGLGLVYITANFVTVSSADKADQGVAAGIFNVALQVGGSVVGLTAMTAIAQSINTSIGHAQGVNAPYTQIAYRAVYYSCVVLAVIGLFLSVVVIKVPETLRGTYWQKKTEPAEEEAAIPETVETETDARIQESPEFELEVLFEGKGRGSGGTWAELLMTQPPPVARSNSTRGRRSRTRRSRTSIPSWDIHTVSWLNLELEEDSAAEAEAEADAPWQRR